MAPPSRRSRGSTDRRGSLGQSLNSCTDEDEAPMDVEAALGQLNEPRHQPHRLSAHNPKDYLDPKALQNYSAQRLYRKYIIEDVLPWCRPLANIPGITDCGFWRERHQSATSLRDSPCPSGRRVSVGASMDGDSTKITYFSEDDEAVDETLTEADKIRSLNEEVQLHVRDMQMERRSHYTSQYSFGQAQQQLAKEDVAAFTRELGLTEAVAQLPPMEEVGVAIANMQRHTDHCDKMAAEAMGVDERLREVHVKIIETKIEHLIGEELRIAAIGMHRAQHEEEAATA